MNTPTRALSGIAAAATVLVLGGCTVPSQPTNTPQPAGATTTVTAPTDTASTPTAAGSPAGTPTFAVDTPTNSPAAAVAPVAGREGQGVDVQIDRSTVKVTVNRVDTIARLQNGVALLDGIDMTFELVTGPSVPLHPGMVGYYTADTPGSATPTGTNLGPDPAYMRLAPKLAFSTQAPPLSDGETLTPGRPVRCTVLVRSGERPGARVVTISGFDDDNGPGEEHARIATTVN